MIADIIDDKFELRHWSVITMSLRKIQDYEYKMLIKKISKKNEMFKSKCTKKIKSASPTIIFMGCYYTTLKGV